MVTRWPLVGRGEELAELERLLAPDWGQGGVALFGDAGVGKTRLVAEVVDARRGDGVAVEWVRATEAAKHIPLGSFAHLLEPVDDAHHPDDLLHVALAELRERSGAATLILAVDDAHLLDESSVALLHLAVTQSAVQVLASVRTAEPVPPGLVGLWKDELLVRLDVGPLTRDATEQLVLAMVGGLVDQGQPSRPDGEWRSGGTVPASLLDRIWRLSRGNPLFVRELVTAAVERRHGGGGGRILLPAEGPRERLRELVEERLRLLEPSWRRALEMVAVGEQVPLEAVERLADPADLEALEHRGLVEIITTDRASTVQVAHPLYGEVLATSLPRLRRRAVIRDLIGAVEDIGQFDRLRLATWRLESGLPGEAEQLLPLAREALGRLDHRLAERLSLAAGGTSRADAGLVLAEALSGQGRIGDAEAVLAELRPAEPEEVARVAIARASELFLHLDRSAEAFDVLRTADTDLAGHPAWQADCRSVMAQMLMFSLRLAEAGDVADELLADASAPETARLRAATVALTVRGAEGRLDAGLAMLDEDLHASARRHRREVPFGDIQLRMARFQGLYWAGRLRELDAYTADNLGIELEQPPPSLRGILAGFRGGALLARGHAAAALAELQRSCRMLAESDWFGQRPLAEAMRTRAAVFAGELVVADEAIGAADIAYAADVRRSARTLPYIELSRAWLRAAQGGAADAAAGCLALATALDHVLKPLAVEVLHAAVRLGRAADAVEALERLADAVDGPFVDVAARHARALAQGDGNLLAAVAREFEDLGADLLAAEAHRAAENAHRRQGRGASASVSARRVAELLRRCGNPRSPALELTVHLGEELTEREREVALLAARGLTSPDIAAALYLSVRTVDTHLHRVYRKLMIDGRHELADALGITTGPPPGTVRSGY
ncbi:MAG TPA: LuxR C-terminal-related transcriptional regulator [Acidimicrobiales bacterium]|nr:LuxR C-terminal-related transcriptional regulator [Acidimicrobiales bacterium]